MSGQFGPILQITNSIPEERLCDRLYNKYEAEMDEIERANGNLAGGELRERTRPFGVLPPFHEQ